MSIRLISLILLAVVVETGSGNAQTLYPLYGAKVPGSENGSWSEAESRANPSMARVVYNVTHPTLTAFLPDSAKATGTAVIIAPGGDFRTLSIDTEGIEVAKWLQAKGVAAFVLKYRLVHSLPQDTAVHSTPTRQGLNRLDVDRAPIIALATADCRQAVEFVRSHAQAFDLWPDRIGLLGFSAGGTLSMAIGFNHTATTRPDFLALMYPYYGGNQPTVPADAPPLFICAAANDPLSPASRSTKLYTDWIAAGKSAELHLYEKGGHNVGMHQQNLPSDQWIDRFGDWLKANGWLKKRRLSAAEKQYGEEVIANYYKLEEARLHTDWAYLNRYAADNQQLKTTSTDSNRVIFLGNSITEAWVLQQPDFFSTHGYIGRGISGQTSGQVLVRFRQDVLSLKPAVVVISIGTNDIAENNGPYDPAFTFGNILSMAELAHAHGIRIVLASVHPVFQYTWRLNITDVPQKIARLNEQLETYARQHNLVYLDYYSAMVDARKGMKAAFTIDGVHPTLAGYQVMAPLAVQAVTESMKR